MVTRGKTYHARKADYKKRVEAYKMKPIIFPDGFVLLQDTREQRSPILTRMPQGLCIQSCTLKDGDYGIGGMPGFAVERKQLSDFCSYCGVERDRTVKKMERFREMEWVGLIVEVDEKDLLCPQEFSKVSPETLRQAINSFEIRYHIHTYFNHDRDACARKLLDWAVKFYQVKREV